MDIMMFLSYDSVYVMCDAKCSNQVQRGLKYELWVTATTAATAVCDGEWAKSAGQSTITNFKLFIISFILCT